MPTLTDHMELSEAARVCVAENILPRATTFLLWRWCRNGVKTATGERIKLAHGRNGGRLIVTRQAIRDFLGALNDADAKHFDKRLPASPNPREASRRVERAREVAAQI